MKVQKGDCVEIPDGRVGRVRDVSGNSYEIGVRRKTSKSHKFINFAEGDIRQVDCPRGWMSKDGYNRYLRKTLAKMRLRNNSTKK